MGSDRIMWAVTSPGAVAADASVAAKVLSLAAALGADLDIFHCAYDAGVAKPGRFASQGIELDIREIVERRHEQLEHNARELLGRGVEIHTSVRWDSPAYAGIVRQVLRREPSLLVAQSRETRRAERLGCPRTDLKLIETCPCPLLLIKTVRPLSGARIVAAVDPLGAHAKPRDLDGAVIEAAQRLAGALAGQVLVFHAPDPQAARRREDLESRVRDLAERYSVAAADVRVVEGGVEERLAGLVLSQAVSIVAFGAVSRGLVRKALAGHTAERLLDRLDCDVLIAKPPRFRSPVAAGSVHRLEHRAARGGKYVF